MCGKSCVVLEDGVDVALERRPARDVDAGQLDRTGGGQLEAGDQAQHGGLAGSGGPEHREELAVGDVEVDSVDGGDRAE